MNFNKNLMVSDHDLYWIQVKVFKYILVVNTIGKSFCASFSVTKCKLGKYKNIHTCIHTRVVLNAIWKSIISLYVWYLQQLLTMYNVLYDIRIVWVLQYCLITKIIVSLYCVEQSSSLEIRVHSHTWTMPQMNLPLNDTSTCECD